MRTRPLGETGVALPVVGQGTWEMEHDPRDEVARALLAGIDAGMTHLDTAEMYGGGHVESLLGDLLAGRRDELFLTSKVLPHNASRDGTIAACESSLERLRTDRIDLYLLHWPGTHPLEETFGAFEALVEQGKIRFWGVSNFDADELTEAVRVAGRGRIACDQVLYHVDERAIEHQVLPACEEHGVGLVGYSPFGSGEFPAQGSPARAALDEVASARGTSARTVALAYLLRAEGTFTIPKAARTEHVLENAAAGVLVLDDDEVARIEAGAPRGAPRRGIPVI